jgi:steroid 5-alpha reductase family enzyme
MCASAGRKKRALACSLCLAAATVVLAIIRSVSLDKGNSNAIDPVWPFV